MAEPNYRLVARRMAIKYGLNPQYFSRQIGQESGFQVAPSGRGPNGEILPNSSGAIGIVQVVPKYHPDAPAADNPVGQIEWMAKYMSGLLKQHGGSWPKALSVYNSGKTDAYLDPNFAKGQTYNYVRSILGSKHPDVQGAQPVTPAAQTALGGGGGADVLQGNVVAAQDGAAAIRSQARQNLSDIASGSTSSTDALAKLPALMGTSDMSTALPTVPGVPAVDVPSKPSKQELSAVNLAKKYLGVKYTWGGSSASTGFDCSGLVQTVWKQLGINVPRTTYEQFKAGKAVDPSALKPGDALFFNDGPNGPEHEGMYIGNGKFIEAPHTGANVRVSTLKGRSDFVGARRFG